VNETASEAMTKKICDCVQEVVGQEEGGLNPVAIMAQLDEEFPERAAGFEMRKIQEDGQTRRMSSAR
jgi:hypothetical protein